MVKFKTNVQSQSQNVFNSLFNLGYISTYEYQKKSTRYSSKQLTLS